VLGRAYGLGLGEQNHRYYTGIQYNIYDKTIAYIDIPSGLGLIARAPRDYNCLLLTIVVSFAHTYAQVRLRLAIKMVSLTLIAARVTFIVTAIIQMGWIPCVYSQMGGRVIA